MIDRCEVSRALAKAIAYKQCGEEGKARDWAVYLVQILEIADIVTEDALIARNQRLPVRP